ncbi:MAG: TonB-dependent receptor [Pseudomonadales bacterium]|nr:TonB-dependent receptor [Pseudomonadales bacterium]
MLEEITVIAQKRDQNQQDVPVAVTSFSGNRLTELGVTDVFDLQAYVPSLVAGQAQHATSSNFAIRGVGTSSQNFGLESSVGLYVDGVYRARQSSLINELVDIDSLQVLRGPQGSLFGRNTPSGAVLINTQQPVFGNTAELEYTTGNYNLNSVNGVLNGVLIEDTLAARFTGFNTERDGFVDDVALGRRQINDRNRFGGRLQLLYTPSDDLSLRLIADYSELDETCCASVTLYNNYISSTGAPGSDGVLMVPGNQFIVPGLIPGFGANIIDSSLAAENLVAFNQLPLSFNRDQGVTGQVDYQIGAGTLTSITAWRSFDSSDDIDADYSDAAILRRADRASQDSFSQELRYTYSGARFTTIVGAYYFNQQLDSTSNTILGSDANNLVALEVLNEAQRLATSAQTAAASGDLAVAAQLAAQAEATQNLAIGIVVDDGFPAGATAINRMNQEHRAWALFGYTEYPLTEQLVLGLGLRYTREAKDLAGTFTEGGAGFGSNLGLPMLTVVNPRPDIATDFNDDNLTGSARLSWFASDTTLLYGSYATGYKSGGTNTDRIHPAFSSVFDAEKSRSLEVGVKTDVPEWNLRVNLAIHDTVTKDFQSNAFQGIGFNLQNAGEVHARGAELESWWYPTEDLAVSVAYIYNDAEIEDFDRASCWVATPFLTGIADPGQARLDDQFCNRSGAQISGNARNNVILTLTRRFRISSGLSGNLHADYRYQGEMLMDNNADPLKVQDPFGLLNVSSSLIIENWNAELTAWVRNATDQLWWGPIFDVPLQAGKLNAYPQEGRTYGVRLRLNLGN